MLDLYVLARLSPSPAGLYTVAGRPFSLQVRVQPRRLVPRTHLWFRCRPLLSTPPHVHLDDPRVARPRVGTAPRAGSVWPVLSGDPDTAPTPRGGGIRRPRVRQGGVLESPAVQRRCGRLPHKGGGGKAGRGGPGAGEAGRGGGGGCDDKAPAPPGRLVLWLHGSAGCTRPRRLSLAAALSSLRAPAATWGSKRGPVSTGCAVPAAGRGAGDCPRGCTATRRRGGNFLGPPGPPL